MNRMLLSHEKRIAQKLDVCVVAFLILQVGTLLVAALLWLPAVFGFGVWTVAYGALILVVASKGWDRFYSFYVGGMSDSYQKRHTHTILTGILFLLLGTGGSVILLLLFLGII